MSLGFIALIGGVVFLAWSGYVMMIDLEKDKNV
jgi:hypothetical protein